MINRKDFLRVGIAAIGGVFAAGDAAGCRSNNDGAGSAGTGGHGGAAGGGGSLGSGGGTGGTGPGGGAGGGLPADGGANACTAHAPSSTIAMNHPPGSEHILTVSTADADAGIEKVYSIQGNATHDHTVTITPQMFVMLRTGATLQTTSSTYTSGGAFHMHGITVVCA